MDNKQSIAYIKNIPKKTPITLYIKEKNTISFPNCSVFGIQDKIVFGDWDTIKSILEKQKDDILDYHIETSCRNSALPLLDIKDLHARIEPGAILRSPCTIHQGAIIMMGAIINIGASIGEHTMIDMNSVIGSNAIIKNNCHIGAGAVIAGNIEPSNALPVIIEDHVFIGANAVILEGIHIHEGAIVGAGSVVTKDVETNTIVIGNPAVFHKYKTDGITEKTKIQKALRQL